MSSKTAARTGGLAAAAGLIRRTAVGGWRSPCALVCAIAQWLL